MKALKIKSILIAAIAATGFAAGSAVAGPIQDTFLKAYDSTNSGNMTELGFFADAANMNSEGQTVQKRDGKNTAVFDADAKLWVINLAVAADKAPGYFLLKFGLPKIDDERAESTSEVGKGKATGGGKGTSDKPEDKFITGLDTYIFKNLSDKTQLVWSNEDVKFLTGGVCTTSGKTGPCNIGRLSHLSYIAGNAGTGTPGGGEVPEPASLALLGAGLAGMALRRRRG